MSFAELKINHLVTRRTCHMVNRDIVPPCFRVKCIHVLMYNVIANYKIDNKLSMYLYLNQLLKNQKDDGQAIRQNILQEK